MGFYKGREDYCEGLAIAHPLVAHKQPTDEEGLLRRSFFRINDEDELDAACKNWIHFPLVAMMGYSGGRVNKDGSNRQRNINEWYFLTQMLPSPGSPFEADAITYAYDLAFDVMNDFINSMEEEYEENGNCGQFLYLDQGAFKWLQVTMSDDLYGWKLTFSDETKAQGNISRESPVIFTTDGFALSTTEGDEISITN